MMRMIGARWKVVAESVLVLTALAVSLNAEKIVDTVGQGVVVRGNNANLGPVVAGTTISRQFEIWNISPHAVEIAFVSPSCSCSVAEALGAKVMWDDARNRAYIVPRA